MLFWIDGDVEGPKSFVGYLHMFSDKTATALNSTCLVGYPVHVVSMICSAEHRRRLVSVRVYRHR